MRKELFHTGWYISKQPGKSIVEAMTSSGDEKEGVVLPYDAMIHESVNPNTKNAGQTGYYPGGMYYYTKDFVAPKEWEDLLVQLEFEGAYGKTMIYLNGDFIGEQSYGYTNFFVTLNDALKYGEENHLEVIVNNDMEKNSRWYSGSGLYRDVQLYLGEEVYLTPGKIRIMTPEVGADTAVVDIQTKIRNRGIHNHAVRILTEIIDSDGNSIAERSSKVTMYSGQSEVLEQRLTVTEPQLWSVDEPNLYQCRIQVVEDEKVWDEVTENFGIRTLSLNPVSGLRINGEEVKLRGTCIHHDHGVIGAVELKDAEIRKIRKLKEAGFNCIRMAHHPAGKKLLEVCDELGMLVMDELFDMWTHTKNSNDFANDFSSQWEKIAEAMVEKDMNHPSVILYGMGNEIQEAGTAKGAWYGRKIHKKLKDLDPIRYTTNSVNGVIAAGDRFVEIVGGAMQQLGMPIPDMKAEEPEQAEKSEYTEEPASKEQGGSDALNSMMGIMVGPLADAIACSPVLTELTEEFMETMDVAGYNYLTGRHELEHKLYPHRVILGTETFPGDIANLWSIVEKNPHVIGDMTWTGYDYLGEAGVGIFHYDGGVNFNAMFPERAAYIGDLDLLGNRRPISYYREIIYGCRQTPYIAVDRLNRYGSNVGRTPWMWKDNIASWTWPGYEGRPAIVNVLSDAEEVELFLNGAPLGRKPAGKVNEYLAEFEIVYQPGELKAVAVRNGKLCESYTLYTAEAIVKLHVEADRMEIKADGQELTYLMISLEDSNGHKNLWEQKEIRLQVEGAGTLAGFGSADPACERSYFDVNCNTFDGYAMAVIRAGLEPGNTKVTVSAEGLESIEIVIRGK